MYIQDADGQTTQFDPAQFVWTADDSGQSTGEFSVPAPTHKAGYYPVYGKFGASLSGTPGAEIAPVQLGTIGYLIPLDSISVDPEYFVPEGGTATLRTNISEDLADLAQNADLVLQTSEGMTATEESWNGHEGTIKLSAEKKGTYSLRAGASIDGKIVSFVPEGSASTNAEIPEACIDANADDVNSSCFVEAAVEFLALDHPLQIQKIGVSAGSEAIPMDGSQWRIYQDNNGSLGDVIVETAKAAVTENGEPITGLFREELPAGVYWLEETQALTGFELLAEPVRFAIDANGTVTLDTGRSSLISVETLNSIPTITVEDVPKLALPEASGTSLLFFTVIGVALMAAVIATALFRMRRIPGRHAA